MKRLGAGWQYAAYDRGNGRVLKRRRHPVPQALKIALGLLYGKEFSYKFLRSEQKRVDEHAKNAVLYMQTIPEKDRWIVANPIFMNAGEYEQDKTHDFEGTHGRIDEYMRLIWKMWELGFSETSYNFMLNAGIDAQGRVVLIDFGEITTDKEIVREHIQTKRWLQHYVFRYFTGEIREYAKQSFETHLTQEKLDELWSTKH